MKDEANRGNVVIIFPKRLHKEELEYLYVLVFPYYLIFNPHGTCKIEMSEEK